MGRNSGGVRGGTWVSNLDAGEMAELNIRSVIADIKRQGYSMKQPFSVGEVEGRMKKWAAANGVELGSEDLYMSPKQIAHTMRDTKEAKGITVSADDLANFPKERKSMTLYFDQNNSNFVYTDGKNKFIVEPNYELKINRAKFKVVNYITASKLEDTKEFNMKKYVEL